jgi:hypothetical protein
MSQEPELWWRAEDNRYANYDEWAEFDQPSGSHLKIEFRSYKVIKHTPKGVWLQMYWNHAFFVLGTARKQHAVPTKELALKDLIARKKVYVSRCEQRLARAREHLTAAEYKLRKLVGKDDRYGLPESPQ